MTPWQRRGVTSAIYVALVTFAVLRGSRVWTAHLVADLATSVALALVWLRLRVISRRLFPDD